MTRQRTPRRPAAPPIPSNEDIDALQDDLRSPNPDIRYAAHRVMDAFMPFDGNQDARVSRAYATYKQVRDLPGLNVKAVLDFADGTNEGRLIAAVAVPWFKIIDILLKDPRAAYEIDPRKWEEIIAGAYVRAGFDEVVLTPRSADKGRDVVATKRGVGSIRIFDQVKAYRPGHVVTADEVCALLGVITGAQNVSKGVFTTTSKFAPRLATDPFIAPHIPYRLELKPIDVLLSWLDDLRETEA
jgi:restriction system protein